MRPKRILPFLLVLLLWGHGAFGWSFGVCGDSRDDNNGVLPRILAAVETSDMEFLIHTGDLEQPGGAAAWQTFREKTKEFTKPLFLVIGNHELQGGPMWFKQTFSLSSRLLSLVCSAHSSFAIVDNAS